MADVFLVYSRVRHVSSGSFMGRDDGHVTYEDKIIAVTGPDELNKILLNDNIEVKQIQKVLLIDNVAVKPSEIRAARETAMREYAKRRKDEELAELEREKRKLDAEIARRRAT